MEAMACQQLLDRAAKAQAVERLDQPAIGTAPTCEEDVGPAVEEEQEGHVPEPTCSFLQSEVQADGDTAHGAHLEVRDHEVDVLALAQGPDAAPGVQRDQAMRWAGEHAEDLLAEGRLVAHDCEIGRAHV